MGSDLPKVTGLSTGTAAQPRDSSLHARPLPGKERCKNKEAARLGVEGQAWGLTPVIPALWEVRQEDHLNPGVRDQPGQHDKTPSLEKVKNN